MKGTKCSWGRSQFRESVEQAATFDQHASRFSATLAGVAVRDTAEHGHAAKLPEHPANSILSGQNGMQINREASKHTKRVTYVDFRTEAEGTSAGHSR